MSATLIIKDNKPFMKRSNGAEIRLFTQQEVDDMVYASLPARSTVAIDIKELKEKFLNHFGRSSVGLLKDDAWKWIEDNLLYIKEEVDIMTDWNKLEINHINWYLEFTNNETRERVPTAQEHFDWFKNKLTTSKKSSMEKDDKECYHPYASIIDEESGTPKCLKCGKLLNT